MIIQCDGLILISGASADERNKEDENFSLGIQHVLAMYAGAILVPLLVGRALNLTAEQLAYLVSIDLLTCGVATWLQARKGSIWVLVCPQYSVVLL